MKILVKSRNPIEPDKEDFVLPHNCFTFLSEKLSIAGVSLWKPRITLASIPSNSIGIGSKDPDSCEAVKIECVFFDKRPNLTIDITSNLHDQSRLWQVIPDDKAFAKRVAAVTEPLFS